MKNAVHAFQRAVDGLIIAHVRDDQFCAFDGRGAARRMHVGTQRIEHPHLMPAREQFAQHMAADKAGPSGQQNTHAGSSSPRGDAYRVATFFCAMRRRTNVPAIFQPA